MKELLIYFRKIYSLDTFSLLLIFQNFRKTDKNHQISDFDRFSKNSDILINAECVQTIYFLKVDKKYFYMKINILHLTSLKTLLSISKNSIPAKIWWFLSNHMKTRGYGEKLISDLKSAPKDASESVKKSNATESEKKLLTCVIYKV